MVDGGQIDPLKFDGFVAYTATGIGDAPEDALYSFGTGGNGLSFNISVYLEPSQYLTNNLKINHCMAGKEHVIIESDGQVYPCLTESYQRGLSFGNIIHEDFGKIYKRMGDFGCQHPLADTCWDHYLWNRLAERVRRR